MEVLTARCTKQARKLIYHLTTISNCHQMDNFSDNDVDLSDKFVVICIALIGQEHVFKKFLEQMN